MKIEELQELLEETFDTHDIPANFHFTISKKGELVIHTKLREDNEGELIDLKADFEEDEDLEFSGNEDFEHLDDEDEDDE